MAGSHPDSVSRLFWIASLLFGLLYLTITPPLRSFDETSHFLKLFTLSKGSTSQSPIPEDVHRFVLAYHPSHVLKNGRYDAGDIISEFSRHENYAQEDMFSNNTADGYFITSYWPAVLTTSVLKVFYPSTIVIFYAARASLLLVSSLILYLTIRHAAIDRRLLLILSLAPMSLFLRSAINADGLTYAYCIAFINLVLRSLQQPDKKHFYLLLLFAFLVAFSKNTYALLVPLALMTPRFSDTPLRHAWMQKIALVGLPLAAGLYWFYYVSVIIGIGTEHFNAFNAYLGLPSWFVERVDAKAQLQHILHHPFHYALILSCFIILWPFSHTNSIFAIIDTNKSFDFCGLYLLPILAFAVLIGLGSGAAFTKLQRLWFLGIFLVITAVIFTAMYLYMAPVGVNYFPGVQGRYFLPILPLLLLVGTYALPERRKQMLYYFGLLVLVGMHADALYHIYTLNY